MSLEKYRRPRMVILHPRSAVHEAARAMADNHVGIVPIAQGQTLVGVVTDRDLALEALGAALDPMQTELSDVMTMGVVTADIRSDVPTVVSLMSTYACRRVPIVEDGKVVGLVSLDDLLLEGDIDARTAADIIRAQLETPARYKPAGAVHPGATARPEAEPRGGRALLRRNARAAASQARVLKIVEQRTGLTDRHAAERALQVVVGSICRRLTPNEARHFIAQLPSALKEGMSAHLDGPNREITRATIERELERVLGLSTIRAAEVVRGVAQAIGETISEGQIATMKAQLPEDLKELFPAPSEMRRELS